MTAIDPRSPSARVVTAPAGSGKTTLLLHHYLRHLGTTPIERIVAITFTRKAAAELVERLATILNAVVDPGSAPPGWSKLEALYRDVLPPVDVARAALASLDAAPVSTVDAFTLSLVQEFLLDARLPLSGGRDAWVDGPVASGADTAVFYEAAARARLEALDRDARTLVTELGVSAAIAEVARLAQARVRTSPSADGLLRALGKALAPIVKKDRDAWREVKTKLPQEAVDAVLAWIDKPKGRPPPAILSWLSSAGSLAEARDAAMSEALREAGIAAEVDGLWEIKHPFEEWIDDEAIDRADRIRAALATVASAVRDDALAAIAREGSLGYDELLEVATRLCDDPPQALATRFDVLMVDELQDTNPSQLAFYRAFARMRRDPPIAFFFVGDARQSIFRFRAADPYGWRALVDEADRDGTRADLTQNFRSSRRLVGLQKGVFDTLAKLADGVDPLPSLDAGPSAEDGLLGGDKPAPVVIVDAPEIDKDVDHLSLSIFAARLAERWKDHPNETAAVLVHAWETGYWAVDALREYGIDAQLTGDRALLESRVAVDLRVFLRALADPSDDVALAAVLKHPSIAVTDRGLLLLRSGGSLARLFAPEPDLGALEDRDRAALSAAMPLLREARSRLGRGPTADVLERLATELLWRPFIGAGPEGERLVGVAQLDVLLDIVRSAEAERVDPQAVIAALDGADRSGADLPVVRMAQDRRVVTVTTVFAAKGLEFDHVLLTETQKPAFALIKNGDGAALLGRPGGQPLLGVRLDPHGGLTPIADPLGVIVRCADRAEAIAEGLRLFYVGFTRAKRSVTFALRKKRKGTLSENLRLAFRAAADNPDHAESIHFISPDEVDVREASRPVRKRATRGGDFVSVWAPRAGWTLARPSGAREILEGSGLVDAFRSRASVVIGPAAAPVPAVPGLEDVPEIVWGDVVHGWLERWHFEGAPHAAEAERYLEERWSFADSRLAEWLVSLGLGVRDGLPGFSELLARAKQIHFEWPLVGVEPDVVWTGRADLVLELEGNDVVILDFKAGSHAATADDIPGIREYAPQLEAYRRMLAAAGKRVVETGLVYVRGVSWVRNKIA
jgi:ATP-dependent helicase/nuclease subunit A